MIDLKVVVVGAGEIGKTVANLLASEGNTVSIIEKDEALAKTIADQSDCSVIKGDGTDLNILKDAGLEKADCVIAASNDDKTNLMVCQIAKSSNIKKIIARVNTPGNEELFTKLGVNSIIPVVGMAVTSIKREVSSDDERVVAQLGAGEVQVFEMTIEEKSNLIGKPPEIKDAVVGAIYRNGELIIPDNRNKIAKGDVLIVLSKTKKVKTIRKQVAGKK